MSWLKESYKRSKRLQDSYSLNGIQIYIKDPLSGKIDMNFVTRYITSRIPHILMKGVDVIYVGQFEDLIKRDVNAIYEDGAIYLTNIQDNEMDIIDDIIHEIAHAAEKEYAAMIYSGPLEREFLGKRRRLYSVLKAEGYEVTPTFRVKLEYDRGIDEFLYQDVGYGKLNNLVNGLLPSAYAATSLREYFAICFEEYFMGDVQYLKSICPIAFEVIESLTEMED
tara:strand:- start:14 stop:682 length:669 start_codon:yes stop_codon:yes gene_type:complete